jgi:hypothetical protein
MFPEKLIVAQRVKRVEEMPSLYGTRKYLALFQDRLAD